MIKCYICGKEITPEEIKENKIAFLRSKSAWTHIQKCKKQSDKQAIIFGWNKNND